MSRLVEVRRQDGFTLIELMVVIAIMGVLAAIALQSYVRYRQRAFDSQAVSDLGNARIAEEAYFVTFNQYVQVPETVGKATVDVPGFVVSETVRMRVDLADAGEAFVVRAKSEKGTGVQYTYDSRIGIMEKSNP